MKTTPGHIRISDAMWERLHRPRCYACDQPRDDLLDVQIMPGVRFESAPGVVRVVEPLTRRICRPCRDEQ